MTTDCLFCKIINREVPANIVFEDDRVLAFEDIRPKAPHHILIIPKEHIPCVNDIEPEQNELIGHVFQVAKTIAKELNEDEKGYRLVFNCNAHGGQEVYHLHLHLLTGRQMTWPPG